MREIQNDCCGCPGLECIHCGREKDYEVIICDICDKAEEDMYEYNGKDYCEDCLFNVWVNENSDDLELVISPNGENIKDVLEYLAECIEDNPSELWYYLSEYSRKRWIEFRDDCENKED